jgi:hypothetical protein
MLKIIEYRSGDSGLQKIGSIQYHMLYVLSCFFDTSFPIDHFWQVGPRMKSERHARIHRISTFFSRLSRYTRIKLCTLISLDCHSSMQQFPTLKVVGNSSRYNAMTRPINLIKSKNNPFPFIMLRLRQTLWRVHKDDLVIRRVIFFFFIYFFLTLPLSKLQSPLSLLLHFFRLVLVPFSLRQFSV